MASPLTPPPLPPLACYGLMVNYRYCRVQGYAIKSTETFKKAGSKLTCRVVFLKYLSIEWNCSVFMATLL